MHRYQRPGQEGVPLSLSDGGNYCSDVLEDEAEREDDSAKVYQKFNPLLHARRLINRRTLAPIQSYCNRTRMPFRENVIIKEILKKVDVRRFLDCDLIGVVRLFVSEQARRLCGALRGQARGPLLH